MPAPIAIAAPHSYAIARQGSSTKACGLEPGQERIGRRASRVSPPSGIWRFGSPCPAFAAESVNVGKQWCRSAGAPCRKHPPLHRTGEPDESRLSFRSEEHTSELQSLMRISYAVLCLKKKK